ncbi:MAG: hypothetical protein AAB579_03270 [Patescibacteria group bacterium]
MGLNSRQKEVLAEKFADLGNIALGSLVFGYVLKSEVLNELSLLIGLGIAFVTYIMAMSLQK